MSWVSPFKSAAKWVAPMVYYPTKYAIEGGKALYDAASSGKGPDGVIGGGGGGSLTPDMNRGLYGGSRSASDSIKAGNSNLRTQGLGQLQQGVQAAQGVAAQGSTLAQAGYGLLGQGQGMIGRGQNVMQGGLQAQGQALDLTRNAAMGNAPSQAQLMLQANADQAAREQMAMAATARGGNQAAAMRSAQAQGSLMQAQAGQQAAAMRAAEMAQARDAFANQSNAAFGAGATMSGLGTNVGALGNQSMGLGFNAQQYGANAQMGAGQFVAGMGNQNLQNQFTGELGAATDLERARMAAEAAIRSGNQAFLGGLIGTAGTVAGAYYGGPAGAAVGGQVGNQIGKNVTTNNGQPGIAWG